MISIKINPSLMTVFSFLLMAIISCNACKTPQSRLSKALSFAKANLPTTGKLVQQKDGYAYIKVDDRYIHELYMLAQAKDLGFDKPAYFRRADAPGAHISVIYKDEKVKLASVGQTFDFILDNFSVVEINKNLSYLIITVKSAAIENLRKNYGLGPKLQGHEFHITVGKKTRKNSAK